MMIRVALVMRGVAAGPVEEMRLQSPAEIITVSMTRLEKRLGGDGWYLWMEVSRCCRCRRVVEVELKCTSRKFGRLPWSLRQVAGACSGCDLLLIVVPIANVLGRIWR